MFGMGLGVARACGGGAEADLPHPATPSGSARNNRKLKAGKIFMGAVEWICGSSHDVHEFARHYDDLARRLAAKMFLHLGARQRGGFDLDSRSLFPDGQPFAQLAVDLHGYLDFVLDEQRLVVFRPNAPGEQAASREEFGFERLV